MEESCRVTAKYGMLTIVQEHRNEKGYTMCECVCECGNTKTIHKTNLVNQRTKSCGCLEKANQKLFKDLRGKKFGKLTPVAPTKERLDGNIIWRCICECGNETFVSSQYLTRGYRKSCGCYLKEKQDIAGQRFGKLIALSPEAAQGKGPRKWQCQCDCGETCSVSISNLKNGHTKSCGCLTKEEHRVMIDGTCLELITSDTIPKNNRSGVKCVSYYSRTDSWVAKLTFKGKQYYLGKYDTVAEAAAARRKAEEELVAPFVEQHSGLLSEKKREDSAAAI